MIKEGTVAPRFSLPNQDGVEVSLEAVDTPYTVIYFYPKDDTPGCTIEAQEFSTRVKEFAKRGATVLGISGGTVNSKEKFCSKYKLSIPLLADESLAVAKRFGAFGEKSFMGRRFKGILRSTFVINKDKKIVKVFPSVQAKGHAEQVLAFLGSGAQGESVKGSRKEKSGSKVARAKKTVKKGAGIPGVQKKGSSSSRLSRSGSRASSSQRKSAKRKAPKK